MLKSDSAASSEDQEKLFHVFPLASDWGRTVDCNVLFLM